MQNGYSVVNKKRMKHMKAKRRHYNLSQGSSTAKPINPLQVRAVIFVLFFALLVLLALGSMPVFAQGSEQISVSDGYAQLVNWSRLSGQTRHDTMQAISQDGFESAETVIVASSENFPDALSATSLAGYYNSPILLTSTNSLTDKCYSEIKRLGAKKVIVVGGTSAVSNNAFSQIQEIVGESNATRLSGSTRFETSLAIYSEGKAASIWSKTAIVASGEGFADALSMSPWAYFQKSPIFLADNEGALSDDAIQAITNDGFERVVIAGGTAVVSDDTQAQLEDIVGEDNVERLAGDNRYDTSQDIVDWCVSEGALKYQGLAIATGENFPDSLSGGALCGHRGSVLMLACDDDYDGAVSSLHENRETIQNADVLGGTAAISDTLYSKLQEATFDKSTYTVAYHSNGGTLANGIADSDGNYIYIEEFDPSDTTSSLTANRFTNEGKTFAYWTLGKSDTDVVAQAAANTTLTYVDQHSLTDENGMYTNTSTPSSKTQAVGGDTIDLYAHWVDNSTGDFWIAAAASTLPDAIDGIAKTQTQLATEIASSGTAGTSDILKSYMNSDAGNGSFTSSTMHLYTRWNEDKALALADRYVEFRIVQAGEHDDDGSAVTFMATHALPTAHQMNTTNTNAGGWGASAMRDLMTSYVAANMPDGFTSAIKTVTKKAYSGSYGSWDKTGTTQDSIWLMSYSELTGKCSDGSSYTFAGDEGSQYTWFSGKVTKPTDPNAAISNLYKTRSGCSPESLYGTSAWLRSPLLTYSGYFLDVNSNGEPVSNISASYCRGICPALSM